MTESPDANERIAELQARLAAQQKAARIKIERLQKKAIDLDKMAQANETVSIKLYNELDGLMQRLAAETESLLENARGKLERKNLDYIVANDVSGSGIGIDADDNAVTILGRDGSVENVPRASKAEIAEAILDRVFAAAGEGARS